MAAAQETRAQQAYSHMRADILAGRLAPGARLRFANLTERYGVSISVMREGLSRLAEQGLVTSEPQHGYRVAPLSVRDLTDLTLARCEIEVAALRHSIANGDVWWESRVVAAQHALDRTPPQSPDDPELLNESWAARHGDYHAALLSGCPSERLVALALALRDSAELYRRWSQPLGDTEARDVPSEHRALTAASLDRDADAAAGLLRQHLERTAELTAMRAPADEQLPRTASMLTPG